MAAAIIVLLMFLKILQYGHSSSGENFSSSFDGTNLQESDTNDTTTAVPMDTEEDGSSSLTFLDWMETTDTTLRPMNELNDSMVCYLYVIGDSTFTVNMGNSSVVSTMRLMRRLIRRADDLFRRMDLDGDGWPDCIGFRIRELAVHLHPYLPDDWKPTGPAFLRHLTTFASENYCYVVVFTSRTFVDDSREGAFAEEDSQHIRPCKWPNVGFVNVNGPSHDLAIVTTARFLAKVFGAHEDGPECANVTSVLADPFPARLTTDTMALSTCAQRDIRETLLKWSSCLVMSHSMDDEVHEDAIPNLTEVIHLPGYLVLSAVVCVVVVSILLNVESMSITSLL